MDRPFLIILAILISKAIAFSFWHNTHARLHSAGNLRSLYDIYSPPSGEMRDLKPYQHSFHNRGSSRKYSLSPTKSIALTRPAESPRFVKQTIQYLRPRNLSITIGDIRGLISDISHGQPFTLLPRIGLEALGKGMDQLNKDVVSESQLELEAEAAKLESATLDKNKLEEDALDNKIELEKEALKVIELEKEALKKIELESEAQEIETKERKGLERKTAQRHSEGIKLRKESRKTHHKLNRSIMLGVNKFGRRLVASKLNSGHQGTVFRYGK